MSAPTLEAQQEQTESANPQSGVPSGPRNPQLLGFLAPLLFTGMMMTVDTPLVNAVLTRLPRAQEALAALVVAFYLALVYEAPHVSMTEVATTLATTRQALGLLRRFYAAFAVGWGVVAVGLLLSPAYDALVQGVMGIPAGVAAAARPTLAVFLLWPVPIGWRRLHQGALIRHGHSRAVGAGATIRLGTLVGSLAGLLAVANGTVGGSTIGAAAMLTSVTAEALYTDLAARRLLRILPAALPGPHPGDPPRAPLTLGALWEVFWPLAGTTLIDTLNRPVLSAGIAAAAVAAAGPGERAGAEEAALAAWGVSWGMIFLIAGATILLSQVAIAWDTDPRPALRRQGARVLIGTGVALSVAVAALVWTPLVYWMLGQVYAVPPALAAVALPVVRLLVPVPLLLTLSALWRGRLIARGHARAVRTAQLIDLAVLIAVLLFGLAWPLPFPRPGGALLAAVAQLAVLTTDAAVLGWSLRRTMDDGRWAIGKGNK